jgi:hypothetical protein
MIGRLSAAAAVSLFFALSAHAADKVPNPTCTVDGIAASDRVLLRGAAVTAWIAKAEGGTPYVPNAAQKAAEARSTAVEVECARRNRWTQAQFDLVRKYASTSLSIAGLEALLAEAGVKRELLDRAWARVSAQDRQALALPPVAPASADRMSLLSDTVGSTEQAHKYAYYYLQLRAQREKSIDALLGE